MDAIQIEAKSRLTAVKDDEEKDYKPFKVSELALDKKHSKELTAFCDLALLINIGTSYNNAAHDLLKSKYDTGSACLSDVRQILDYFGGDCLRYVGKPLLVEVRKALERHGYL